MDNLDAHFALEKLETIWTAFKDARYDVYDGAPRVATGADRIGLAEFERDKDKHFRALRRKVLESRYTFSPFREKNIPKVDGGTRTLSIGSIRDALCQLALYEYLYDSIDAMLTESVYGYRRGHSVHEAVRAIRKQIGGGASHVLDADIKKFFDNLDHQILMEKVTALGADPRVSKLILRFIKTPGHKEPSPSLKAERRTSGVPQGGIISGLLTNLYLAEFDRQVREVFPGYVRYADDFVVPCASAAQAEEAQRLADRILRELKLQLHGSPKTACRPISFGFDFLGFRFTTSKLSVKPANISKLKSRIADVIERIPPDLSPEATLGAIVFRITQKVRGPAPEFIAPLMAAGQLDHPHRRNWIGFFRVIDDDVQIKSLDNWIRSRVSKCMWDRHKMKVKLSDMKQLVLRARSSIRVTGIYFARG